MKRLIIATAILALGVASASADERIYPHDAITHSSNDPVLDELVAEALADWGQYSGVTDGGEGLDIVAAWGGEWFETYPEWMGYAVLTDGPCHINIKPRRYPYWTIVHEVGHCLGLSHPGAGVFSIMQLSSLRDMTAFDQQSVAELYPRPYRVVVPMVSR